MTKILLFRKYLRGGITFRAKKQENNAEERQDPKRWIEGQDKNDRFMLLCKGRKRMHVLFCSIGVPNETKGIPTTKPWHPLWWSESWNHCVQLMESGLLPLSQRLKLELTYSLLHLMFLFKELEHGTKVSLLTS